MLALGANPYQAQIQNQAQIQDQAQIQEIDYSQYIMDPNNQVARMDEGGRDNNSIIITYQDNSRWVFLNDSPVERFCGFLYLQQAIKDSNLNSIRAAENKIAIHKGQIIYLSRYYGNDVPEELLQHRAEISVLKNEIGYDDVVGNVNLRKQDNTVYVFDTEKDSFKREMYEKIDSFVQQHNLIRAALEKSLNN
jgi:hypothetical protein